MKYILISQSLPRIIPAKQGREAIAFGLEQPLSERITGKQIKPTTTTNTTTNTITITNTITNTITDQRADKPLLLFFFIFQKIFFF